MNIDGLLNEGGEKSPGVRQCGHFWYWRNGEQGAEQRARDYQLRQFVEWFGWVARVWANACRRENKHRDSAWSQGTGRSQWSAHQEEWYWSKHGLALCMNSQSLRWWNLKAKFVDIRDKTEINVEEVNRRKAFIVGGSVERERSDLP